MKNMIWVVQKLMFGWDFEDKIQSRFWYCNLFKICELWSSDMNSTLRSVVPLAMFQTLPVQATWSHKELIHHFGPKPNPYLTPPCMLMAPTICMEMEHCLLGSFKSNLWWLLSFKSGFWARLRWHRTSEDGVKKGNWAIILKVRQNEVVQKSKDTSLQT